MLPTLEYVTDGVISIRSRTRINPHRISDHRFIGWTRERISRTIGRRGAQPMILENAAVLQQVSGTRLTAG
jgi:hypothetical protein